MNITKPADKAVSLEVRVSAIVSKIEKALFKKASGLKQYSITVSALCDFEALKEIKRLYEEAGWCDVACYAYEERRENYITLVLNSPKDL